MAGELAKYFEPALDEVGTFALPHHGSRRSFHADLLAMFNGQMPTCVVGAGVDNKYGHPHTPVVQAVGDYGKSPRGRDGGRVVALDEFSSELPVTRRPLTTHARRSDPGPRIGARLLVRIAGRGTPPEQQGCRGDPQHHRTARSVPGRGLPAVRDGQRELGLLLDQEHRHTELGVDAGDLVEHAVDEER